MRKLFDPSDKLKLMKAKEAILGAIGDLDVKKAFHLFRRYDLPFDLVLDGKYSTALHRLIAYRAFSYVRWFLRLISELPKPENEQHLTQVLSESAAGSDSLYLSDYAISSLFEEMEAASQNQNEEPDKTKELAAMVHFIIKFTGKRPTKLPAFTHYTPGEQDRWLNYCEKAYGTLFSKKKRAKWEEEFGVLAQEKASPIAPSR